MRAARLVLLRAPQRVSSPNAMLLRSPLNGAFRFYSTPRKPHTGTRARLSWLAQLGVAAAASLKAAKLIPVASIFISSAAYAYVFGWAYGAGIVALICIHELGHYLAMRYCLLRVGKVVFLPFVGAWIEMKDQRVDARTQAFVALAGPTLGSFGAFLFLVAANITGSTLLLAVAQMGFMLNLFNLVPCHPFDGGKVMHAVSPVATLFGVVLVALLYAYHPQPLVALMLVAAAVGTAQSLGSDSAASSGLSGGQRALVLFCYCVLAAYLMWMTQQLSDRLPSSRHLAEICDGPTAEVLDKLASADDKLRGLA
eukprot:TRINITY_DN5277_c0_g1_i1.p2 TRINITY_DN5277_c0_g1~~TRINITY_DN5277_c0_g1_i1.p2  ORF type:complete len:318 (+),score=28.05 TRINITY_DN5277_c0_g1_i1:24-956(+)